MPIWLTLLLFVTSFVLTAVLTPKPDIENARAGKLGDLRFPRASAGAPIPVIFGKVRFRAPNTTWFGNFKAVARTVKVKTGLFSSTRQTVGYDYHVSMDLALCLGPNVTLHRVWAGKNEFSSGLGLPINGDGILATVDRPNFFGGPERGGGLAGKIRFYSGSFSQSRNAYLMTKATNGADLPAYPGVCHIVFEERVRTFTLPMIGVQTIITPFYIGSQPQLHPMSFELSRYPDNLGLGANRLIGDDLNPAEIIYSILTEVWGGLGLSSTVIDTATFTAVGTTLKAENNGASITIASASDARSVIQEMLRQIDGILYQDPTTGKIAIRLIRADYTIGLLPVFDETNVEEVEDFSRTSWSETANLVRVLYNSRAKLYTEAAALVQDQANISMQERVRSVEVSYPGVTTETLATTIGTRELSQLSVPLFKARLRSNRLAATLKPGDPFVFSWDDYGLVSIVLRVQRFDFGEFVSGDVIMECIQDKFATATTVYGIPPGGLDDPGENPALDIVKYAVFESPYYFITALAPPFVVTADSSYLWALARDPNTRHDGYSFLTSPDAFTEDIVTELNRVPFPYSCELVGSLFRDQAQDDGILAKVVVRIPDPAGTPFSSQSASDIRTAGKGLLLVASSTGLEFMAYEGFTDLGTTVELNTVHRALIDTMFLDHIDGDIVYVITGVDWISQQAHTDTGSIDYQLLSFTAQDQQEVGDFATQTIVKAQRYDKPLPPDMMEIEGLRAPIEVLSVTDIDITAFLERNRVLVPQEIVLLSDSTDTPEASTTYTARMYLDGVLVDTDTALTHAGLPFNLQGLSGAGIVRVELEAVRAVGASWTPDWAEFFYANYLNLSAERLTNGNFEASLATGWSVITGTWNNPVTAYPLDAVRTVGASSDDQHLESLTGTPAEIRQNYTIPGADAGKSGLFRIWKLGKNTATGQIIIELRDGVGALKTITTPLVAATTSRRELIEIPLPFRSDATTVRVRIMGTGAGSSWDNASLKNHTTSPAPNLTYDTVTGLTVVGLWSLRLAHSTYAGALVRIRDTFDDTEQDVGADPDGNLEPFYVRGEARVVTLYDQSGNAVNLTALNASRQPRLYWNLTETGRPYIKFDNSNDQLRDATAGTARPYMALRPNVLFASGPDVDTNSSFLFSIAHQDGTGTTARWGLDGDTDWGVWLNAAATNDAGATAPNVGKSLWWLDYQNGLGYHNDDAASTVGWVAADVTYPNSTRLKISAAGDDTLMWGGTFSELCIFTGNIAGADRKTVMEEVALYWYNLAV